MKEITKKSYWGKQYLLILVAIALGFFLCLSWRTEKVLASHQEKFLKALEDRNWGKVQGFLADNYQDRFGHSRQSVQTDLREVLRQFFALTIRPQGAQWDIQGDSAVVTMNITISGTGTGATEFITSEVNRLPEPWKFYWHKTGIWPWSWQVEKVDNAALRLDRSMQD